MLKVINPGILTTIQDQGRKNYRSFGVPISGVMDHYAANCANYLLGNSEKEAVIEITMGGVTIRCHGRYRYKCHWWGPKWLDQ